MPFPVLDACLHLYAGEKMSPDEVEAALRQPVPQRHARRRRTTWATRFTTLFTQSIYKWVQSPLSLHVGSLDLDRERALQMPVVQKTEWTSTRPTRRHEQGARIRNREGREGAVRSSAARRVGSSRPGFRAQRLAMRCAGSRSRSRSPARSPSRSPAAPTSPPDSAAISANDATAESDRQRTARPAS